MDGAPVLLFCPKPCCKLPFSGFLPSTVPYWNQYRLLICHYNRNTHNVAFCIFSCRKLPYVMKNKRTDHISKIMSKRQGIFTENFTIFYSNAEKTANVPEFEFNKF